MGPQLCPSAPQLCDASHSPQSPSDQPPPPSAVENFFARRKYLGRLYGTPNILGVSMNSLVSYPSRWNTAMASALVSDVSKPTTFSTSTCVGGFSSLGTTSRRRRRKDCDRPSSLSFR